jgi:hypothetical protein
MARFDGINFSPPQGVRAACARGLVLHGEGLSGGGLQPDTVAWARRIARGSRVSPDKARKMNRFFGRNARFADAPKDSPAWVSWLLWGGAPGAAWARKLVKQMDAEQQLNHRVAGVPVALAAKASPDGVSPWNKLAYEVALKGRGDVALTKQDFVDCVANFKRFGREVPVVLYHADTKPEAHPLSAAAHGWITEMRVGTMQRGGKTVATLEARFRWVNEATRTMVENGELAYGSVTLVQNGTDEESGEDIGSYLWSFSLTNNPALVDIPRIAAEAVGGVVGEPLRTLKMERYYGPMATRDDALAMLRYVLRLPMTADYAAVLAELGKLAAMVASGEESGVEWDDIVECISEAMRLPALTSPADVVDAAKRAIAPTDTTVAPMSAASQTSADVPPQNGGPRVATERSHMAQFTTLAARLGVAAASEEDATAFVIERAQETGDVRRSLNLSIDAPAGAVVAKLAELSAAAARVPGLVAEIEVAKTREGERVERELTAHLDAMIVAEPALKSVRGALEMAARADFAAFAAAHPLPKPAASALLAGGRITAPAQGTDKTPPALYALPKRHGDAAGARAKELMAADPKLTLEAALIAASREIKAASQGVR